MQFFLKTTDGPRYRDKQIVDETGLYRRTYDITLHLPIAAMQGTWRQESACRKETASDNLSAAQKAGIKYVSRKETLPVVIIDHIDQPTPN